MAFEKFLVFIDNRRSKPSSTSTEIQVNKIEVGGTELNSSTVVQQSDLTALNSHVSGDGEDHSTVASNKTHCTGDGSDHQDVADLTTLSGVVANSANLGAFSGTIIPDDQTIKQALQALETQMGTNISDISSNTSHATGDGSDHQDVADLATLSGVAANSTGLGAFSGSTIPDDQTIKQALQALETAEELKLPLAGGTMSGDIAMAGHEVTGLPGTPTGASSAASKAYVDQLVLTGGTVREALLISEQMDDTDGINAAMVAYIVTNPADGDTFVIKNGSTTETFTFRDTEDEANEVQIGVTVVDTMTNLAQAINDDSAAWDAKYTSDGLDSINSDGVVVIYEQASAAGTSDSRIYGTIAGGNEDIQVVEYNGQTEYKTSKAAIDLPSSDPAAGRFGLRKQQSALNNGEIHLSLEDDVLKSWNEDATAWLTLSGSGSLPDATAASGGGIKGKVTFDSDKGLGVSSGVAEVKIDDSTIDFTAGALQVKALGITNSHINAAAAIAETKLDLAYSTGTLNTAITNHTSDTNNPHGVDAGDIYPSGISNSDIAAAAGIVLTKLANGTSAYIIVCNGSAVPTYVAMSGDITISNAGVTAIGADKVKDTMVDWGTEAGQVAADDIPAVHSAVNYTPGNANIDGHLSGIDTALAGVSSDTELFVNDTGDGLVQGAICFLDTDGKATAAGAGVANIYKKEIIVADATIADSESGAFVTKPGGLVTKAGESFTVGEEVYLSSTAKGVTQNVASITSGHEVIILGYARSATTFKLSVRHVGQAE